MKKFGQLFMSVLAMMTMVSCTNDKVTSMAESSYSTSSDTVPTSDGESSKAENESSSQEAITLAYTFDWNYEGAGEKTIINQTEGQLIIPPQNQTRDGYLFSYWATDRAGESVYDLSAPVSKATTLYAIWIEASQAITITFHSNDEGAPNDIYIQMSIAANSRLKSFPGSLSRDGYYFKNWYTSETFDKVATSVTKYQQSTDIYARWFDVDVFEAEYTKLTDLTYEEDPNINDFGEKIGHGYSSDVSGTGLIFDDSTIGSTCSNHHFICDLYYKGAFIQFDVNAERDTEDAVLIATLSAEYFDMTFTPNNWIVEINGVSLEYGTIVLDGVPTGRDAAYKRPFSKHTLSSAVPLKAGKNVIRLITNNSTRHDSTGTMAAEAPMIDCLTCYSDAGLTFDAHTDNL